MNRRKWWATLIGLVPVICSGAGDKLARAFRYRSRLMAPGDVAEFKRLGPDANGIWELSSRQVLEKLPRVSDIVRIETAKDATGKPVVVLEDIDGVRCTFWCVALEWTKFAPRADQAISDIEPPPYGQRQTLVVKDISPY